MKIDKAGKVIIAISIAFIIFAVGMFIGNRSVGEGIYVKTEKSGEADNTAGSGAEQDKAIDADDTYDEPEKSPENTISDKININTAGIDELIELPGIGDTLAQRIVAYRKEHGRFDNIGDIMDVKGIGEAKFNAIRDLITIQ